MQYLKFADYIYVMDEGRIVDEGEFEDIKDRGIGGLYEKFLELDEVSISKLNNLNFNMFSGVRMPSRKLRMLAKTKKMRLKVLKN